jgi:hypothetical protein
MAWDSSPVAQAQREAGAAATGSDGSSTIATGRGAAPADAVAASAVALRNCRRLERDRSILQLVSGIELYHAECNGWELKDAGVAA